MASNTDLRVRISADLADVKAGLGLLRGELAKVKQQSAQAFSAGSGNALIGSLRRMRVEVVSLVGAYASLAGGKMLAGIADQATQIRGRIREAKGDYQAILALANETRTGLMATTDLYTRIERSTRGQINSQSELLGLTKSVNQAIKLSYQGTAQGEAAVLQLGQALASGKLAGDELRSLSENAPRLMEAIAAGIGVQSGALKGLAKDGKLTSEVVIKALQSQAQVLETEYARVPITIGDAFTQIRNNFIDYIGKADEANSASQKFAAGLQALATNLPRILDPILAAIVALAKNLDVLAVYIGMRLALSALPAMAAAIRTVIGLITAARAVTLTWSVALAALGGPVGIALAALAAGLYLVYKRTNDAKVAAEEHRKALADNAQMANVSAGAALRDAQAKRAQAAATLQAARAALEERRARFADTNTSRTARGGDRGDGAAFASTNALIRQRAVLATAEKEYKDWGDRLAKLAVEMQVPITAPAVATAAVVVATGDKATKAGKKAKEAKEAVKGVIDVSALALDQIQRDLAALEQLFEEGKIKAADYFAQRSALQAAALDKQIEQAKEEARTATSTEQQSRALTEIIKLQRDRLEIGPRAAREQAKAEGEALKKTQETLDEEFSRIGGNLRTETDYINAQAQLGAIGPVEAERQLQAVRATSIEQYQKLISGQQAYLDSMSPTDPRYQAAHEGLRRTQTELANVQAQQEVFKNQIKDQATQSLTTFFTDLASGAKSFKDAFKDMVRSFVAGIAQMIAQKMAAKIIDGLFASFGGASANGNIFGPGGMQKFAKGAAFGLAGITAFANGGAFTNSLVDSPTLFAFGKGGQFGVMGEAGPEAVMPLERGSDGKLGVRNNGGSGSKRPTRIVLVENQRDAEAMMRSSRGEEAMLLHIENNAGKIREILG